MDEEETKNGVAGELGVDSDNECLCAAVGAGGVSDEAEDEGLGVRSGDCGEVGG